MSGPVRTTWPQAFSERRSALHEIAPQPLLHAIFLQAVANAADGPISAQFVGDIQQREGVRNPSIDIKVAPRFFASVVPSGHRFGLIKTGSDLAGALQIEVS